MGSSRGFWRPAGTGVASTGNAEEAHEKARAAVPAGPAVKSRVVRPALRLRKGDLVGVGERSRRLRELIASPAILIAPGVFDGFSARLVQSRGFAAALVTGAGVSESRYAFPDIGLIGLAEQVDAVQVLTRCVDIPLIADGDTGYGNAVNVYHTVRAFDDAGAAAVMIEDQTWPKRCGHMAGKEVISAEEMVEKIHAAVEGRRSPEFIIKARTDAAGPLGIAEAIRRANLYAEAGAELLFADALLTEEDIATFCRETVLPVAVNMGFGIRSRPTTPLLSPKRLQELGVAVAEYPRMLTAAALMGMTRALDAFEETLHADRVPDRADLAVSFDELNDLIGVDTMRELEVRFATPGRKA